MSTEQEKAIIELSNDFKEANDFLEFKLGLISTHSKIEYLTKNFNVSFVGHEIENSYDNYIIILTSIINKKWN